MNAKVIALVVVVLVLPGVSDYTLGRTSAGIPAASSQLMQNVVTLDAPIQVTRLVQIVQRDLTFIAAENQTTYAFIGYAGFGVNYENGTSNQGDLILYFDQFISTGPDCQPVIGAQLQVITSGSGDILAIQSINNQGELNNYYGGPPVTVSQEEVGSVMHLC